jgi:hypothetical protein
VVEGCHCRRLEKARSICMLLPSQLDENGCRIERKMLTEQAKSSQVMSTVGNSIEITLSKLSYA